MSDDAEQLEVAIMQTSRELVTLMCELQKLTPGRSPTFTLFGAQNVALVVIAHKNDTGRRDLLHKLAEYALGVSNSVS